MKPELYHCYPYAEEFSAKVCESGADWVILDQTLFYPGGGGQEHDLGSINGLKVTEVIKENGRIVHKVAGHNFQKDETVQGRIAWPRRYELMKGHTGEHLLFSALKQLNPELELVKIAIGEDKKYLIVKGEVDWTTAMAAQATVLKHIADDLEINEEIVAKDDPVLEEIRIKKERINDGEVRIIRIGTVDASACSGIHVQRTSEIGMLLIAKINSAKPAGDWELEFLVGEAAKEEAARQSAQFMQLVTLLGAQKNNLLATVENLQTAKENAEAALKKYMAQTLQALQPEMINGIPLYCAALPALEKKTGSDYVASVTKEKGVCILGSGLERYSLTIACHPEIPLDCSKILNEVLAADSGRGGGKTQLATGGASNPEGPTNAVQRARELVQMYLTQN